MDLRERMARFGKHDRKLVLETMVCLLELLAEGDDWDLRLNERQKEKAAELARKVKLVLL